MMRRNIVGSQSQKKQMAGKAAYYAASNRLRERYADEYAELLGEERESRGLLRERATDVLGNLRKRIAELEDELLKAKGRE